MATITEQTAASHIAPPRRWRFFINLILALIILLCGMLTGGGIAVYVLSTRLIEALHSPEAFPPRAAERMRVALGLTDEQTEGIKSIFEKRLEQVEQFRAHVLPLLKEELEDLRAEVDALLTPEQSKQWNKRVNRWRSILGPSPDESAQAEERMEPTQTETGAP